MATAAADLSSDQVRARARELRTVIAQGAIDLEWIPDWCETAEQRREYLETAALAANYLVDALDFALENASDNPAAAARALADAEQWAHEFSIDGARPDQDFLAADDDEWSRIMTNRRRRARERWSPVRLHIARLPDCRRATGAGGRRRARRLRSPRRTRAPGSRDPSRPRPPARVSAPQSSDRGSGLRRSRSHP